MQNGQLKLESPPHEDFLTRKSFNSTQRLEKKYPSLSHYYNRVEFVFTVVLVTLSRVLFFHFVPIITFLVYLSAMLQFLMQSRRLGKKSQGISSAKLVYLGIAEGEPLLHALLKNFGWKLKGESGKIKILRKKC